MRKDARTIRFSRWLSPSYPRRPTSGLALILVGALAVACSAADPIEGSQRDVTPNPSGTPPLVNDDGYLVDDHGQPILDDHGQPIPAPTPTEGTPTPTPGDTPGMTPTATPAVGTPTPTPGDTPGVTPTATPTPPSGTVTPTPTPTPGPQGTPGPMATPPPTIVCENPGTISVGKTPLRRISQVEFNNSVRDLFLDTSAPARDGTFPSDELVGSFVSNSRTLPTVANNEQMLALAEAVSRNTTQNLSQVTGCTSPGDTACVQGFLTRTAERAFRGAWSPEAGTAINSIYQQASSAVGQEMGLQTAIQAILLNPRFLYHVEFGVPNGSVARLTAREVAGRLAAFLWLSVPSAELLQAADSGALDTPDGVRQIASGMVNDSRFEAVTTDFARQWLLMGRVENIVTNDPAFTTDIRSAMHEETLGTVRNALLNGSFQELLTAPNNPPANLAAYYGAGSRPGVLTQGSVLASNPGPVKRGHLVRQQIMCDEIHEPPAGVEALTGDGATSIEVFRQHAAEPGCWACHQFMDPVGVGFAFYDSLGRYSETENGHELTTAGEFIPGPVSTLTGTFQTTEEMLSMLATDESIQQCFTKQIARYALRRFEQSADGCSLTAIHDEFTGNQTNIRQLLIAIAGSDMFLHRNAQ